MVKVVIDSIRVSLMSQDRVIVLREEGAERYLPIWIGPFEAEAIRVELQGTEITRPLTHDLLKTVIRELGGEVEQIVVSDLRNDVFYARLMVRADGKQIEIDSRPSDAIALAVRLSTPIFVAESVLEKAAIEPAQEINLETGMAEAEATPEGDEEDLGAFKDFLDSLDMDDLE